MVGARVCAGGHGADGVSVGVSVGTGVGAAVAVALREGASVSGAFVEASEGARVGGDGALSGASVSGATVDFLEGDGV